MPQSPIHIKGYPTGHGEKEHINQHITEENGSEQDMRGVQKGSDKPAGPSSLFLKAPHHLRRKGEKGRLRAREKGRKKKEDYQ